MSILGHVHCTSGQSSCHDCLPSRNNFRVNTPAPTRFKNEKMPSHIPLSVYSNVTILQLTFCEKKIYVSRIEFFMIVYIYPPFYLSSSVYFLPLMYIFIVHNLTIEIFIKGNPLISACCFKHKKRYKEKTYVFLP